MASKIEIEVASGYTVDEDNIVRSNHTDESLGTSTTQSSEHDNDNNEDWGLFPKSERHRILEQQRTLTMDPTTTKILVLSQAIFAACMAITVWRIAVIEADGVDIKPINLSQTFCETHIGRVLFQGICREF